MTGSSDFSERFQAELRLHDLILQAFQMTLVKDQKLTDIFYRRTNNFDLEAVTLFNQRVQSILGNDPSWQPLMLEQITRNKLEDACRLCIQKTLGRTTKVQILPDSLSTTEKTRIEQLQMFSPDFFNQHFLKFSEKIFQAQDAQLKDIPPDFDAQLEARVKVFNTLLLNFLGWPKEDSEYFETFYFGFLYLSFFMSLEDQPETRINLSKFINSADQLLSLLRESPRSFYFLSCFFKKITPFMNFLNFKFQNLCLLQKNPESSIFYHTRFLDIWTKKYFEKSSVFEEYFYKNNLDFSEIEKYHGFVFTCIERFSLFPEQLLDLFSRRHFFRIFVADFYLYTPARGASLVSLFEKTEWLSNLLLGHKNTIIPSFPDVRYLGIFSSKGEVSNVITFLIDLSTRIPEDTIFFKKIYQFAVVDFLNLVDHGDDISLETFKRSALSFHSFLENYSKKIVKISKNKKMAPQVFLENILQIKSMLYLSDGVYLSNENLIDFFENREMITPYEFKNLQVDLILRETNLWLMPFAHASFNYKKRKETLKSKNKDEFSTELSEATTSPTKEDAPIETTENNRHQNLPNAAERFYNHPLFDRNTLPIIGAYMGKTDLIPLLYSVYPTKKKSEQDVPTSKDKQKKFENRSTEPLSSHEKLIAGQRKKEPARALNRSEESPSSSPSQPKQNLSLDQKNQPFSKKSMLVWGLMGALSAYGVSMATLCILNLLSPDRSLGLASMNPFVSCIAMAGFGMILGLISYAVVSHLQSKPKVL